MAQHIVRDSKGRIEQILDDKEYAEHTKWNCCLNGCLAIVVGVLIILFFVYVSSESDNEKDVPSKNKTEMKSEPHQSNVTVSENVTSNNEVSMQQGNFDDETTDISEYVEEEAITEETFEDNTETDNIKEEPVVIDEDELVRRMNEE